MHPPTIQLPPLSFPSPWLAAPMDALVVCDTPQDLQLLPTCLSSIREYVPQVQRILVLNNSASGIPYHSSLDFHAPGFDKGSVLMLSTQDFLGISSPILAPLFLPVKDLVLVVSAGTIFLNHMDFLLPQPGHPVMYLGVEEAGSATQESQESSPQRSCPQKSPQSPSRQPPQHPTASPSPPLQLDRLGFPAPRRSSRSSPASPDHIAPPLAAAPPPTPSPAAPPPVFFTAEPLSSDPQRGPLESKGNTIVNPSTHSDSTATPSPTHPVPHFPPHEPLVVSRPILERWLESKMDARGHFPISSWKQHKLLVRHMQYENESDDSMVQMYLEFARYEFPGVYRWRPTRGVRVEYRGVGGDLMVVGGEVPRTGAGGDSGQDGALLGESSSSFQERLSVDQLAQRMVQWSAQGVEKLVVVWRGGSGGSRGSSEDKEEDQGDPQGQDDGGDEGDEEEEVEETDRLEEGVREKPENGERIQITLDEFFSGKFDEYFRAPVEFPNSMG